MKAVRIVILVSVSFSGASAGFVDVTHHTAFAMPAGNNLLFTFSTSSFTVNAINYGLPGTPSNVTFSFVAAAGLEGEFVAILESPDGAVTARLAGAVAFVPGEFQGSLYRGPVSVATGTFALTPSQSQQLVATNSAVLDLINVGGDTSVGLSPYVMSQDLFVSLSSSELSVGAPVLQVLLDPPDAVPEPATWSLLLASLGFAAAVWSIRRVFRVDSPAATRSSAPPRLSRR